MDATPDASSLEVSEGRVKSRADSMEESVFSTNQANRGDVSSMPQSTSVQSESYSSATSGGDLPALAADNSMSIFSNDSFSTAYTAPVNSARSKADIAPVADPQTTRPKPSSALVLTTDIMPATSSGPLFDATETTEHRRVYVDDLGSPYLDLPSAARNDPPSLFDPNFLSYPPSFAAVETSQEINALSYLTSSSDDHSSMASGYGDSENDERRRRAIRRTSAFSIGRRTFGAGGSDRDLDAALVPELPTPMVPFSPRTMEPSAAPGLSALLSTAMATLDEAPLSVGQPVTLPSTSANSPEPTMQTRSSPKEGRSDSGHEQQGDTISEQNTDPSPQYHTHADITSTTGHESAVQEDQTEFYDALDDESLDTGSSIVFFRAAESDIVSRRAISIHFTERQQVHERTNPSPPPWETETEDSQFGSILSKLRRLGGKMKGALRLGKTKDGVENPNKVIQNAQRAQGGYRHLGDPRRMNAAPPDRVTPIRFAETYQPTNDTTNEQHRSSNDPTALADLSPRAVPVQISPISSTSSFGEIIRPAQRRVSSSTAYPLCEILRDDALADQVNGHNEQTTGQDKPKVPQTTKHSRRWSLASVASIRRGPPAVQYSGVRAPIEGGRDSAPVEGPASVDLRLRRQGTSGRHDRRNSLGGTIARAVTGSKAFTTRSR